jgi:hypothetical protein
LELEDIKGRLQGLSSSRLAPASTFSEADPERPRARRGQSITKVW